MPVIEVHLIEGYSGDAKRRLSEALTDASRTVVPAPVDAITVMIHEMPVDHYLRGRSRKQPASELPDAEERVLTFLGLLTSRDVKAANSMLADTATLHFPASAVMHNLEELLEWASLRYRSITKHIAKTESFGSSDGATIVYCSGTLEGVWLDDSPFKDIRFIDRFECRDGLITRQDVWNDLAEHSP